MLATFTFIRRDGMVWVIIESFQQSGEVSGEEKAGDFEREWSGSAQRWGETAFEPPRSALCAKTRPALIGPVPWSTCLSELQRQAYSGKYAIQRWASLARLGAEPNSLPFSKVAASPSAWLAW